MASCLLNNIFNQLNYTQICKNIVLFGKKKSIYIHNSTNEYFCLRTE